MHRTCPTSLDSSIREQYFGNGPIVGVTGVILAGGASSRMGTNKALLLMGGQTLIERVYAIMAVLFSDVIIVTNTPESYAAIPCRTVADIYPGAGSIAGLHAGLNAGSSGHIFVAACDMPFLNPELIRLLCRCSAGYDAVVPLNSIGLREPLHALYARTALAPMQQAIEQGDKSILHLLDRLNTRLVVNEEFHCIAGAEESFRNVNTREEYAVVREMLNGVQRVCDCAG